MKFKSDGKKAIREKQGQGESLKVKMSHVVQFEITIQSFREPKYLTVFFLME